MSSTIDITVVAIAVISTLFALGFPLLLAGPLTWAERRQSAYMQDRIGPNRASIMLAGKEIRAFGLLSPLADVIKLITKEDTIHHQVDKFLYNLAPLVSLFPALVTFAIIPFGPDLMSAAGSVALAPFADGSVPGADLLRYPLQAARVDIGILYIFAMSSLAVFGVTLAGYASTNKFAMLGGLRASAQMISYEVTLGLSVLGLVMAFQTLEPASMVYQQGHLLWGIIPKWGILIQPIGFLVFMTAATAENKRVPFDLAEGESEIIGYFIEYSGMKFGMFFMAEYIEVVVIGGVVTTLFLGGWQIPFLFSDGFHLPGGVMLAMSQWVVTGLCVLSFILKVLFMCWFQLTIRWSLPRFRYDQVMWLGWRVLLPLSLFNLLVTGWVILS
ncbi:MAG: complex I subunit 1 family protein [Myxococcota bacterium]